MMNIITINLLKLINYLITTSVITNKINNFYLNVAYQTISKLKKVKKKNNSVKQIKNILLFSGIRLKIKDDEFYYKLLNLITNHGDAKKNRIYLKNFLKSQSLNSIGFRTWLRLRDIFYLKLELVLGGVCREKALNSAIKSDNSFFLSRKDRARARLDATLNVDDSKSHLNKFPLEYDFNQKKFMEILNNKSVAIVGPAESDSNDASEIDSFDIVVRLNYTNTGANLSQFNTGVKIDISYFNGEQIDYLIANNNSKLPNDLKVACIKDNNKSRKNKVEKANPKKIIKRIANYNMLNFYSSFNLLPLALLDILETNVKIIKIFHADLFLTKNRTLNYYPSAFKKHKSILPKLVIESFLDHDPMMHHKFLKNIYNNDKIIGDTKFDQVMKLDTHEYLKRLEEIYR